MSTQERIEELENRLSILHALVVNNAPILGDAGITSNLDAVDLLAARKAELEKLKLMQHDLDRSAAVRKSLEDPAHIASHSPEFVARYNRLTASFRQMMETPDSVFGRQMDATARDPNYKTLLKDESYLTDLLSGGYTDFRIVPLVEERLQPESKRNPFETENLYEIINPLKYEHKIINNYLELTRKTARLCIVDRLYAKDRQLAEDLLRQVKETRQKFERDIQRRALKEGDYNHAESLDDEVARLRITRDYEVVYCIAESDFERKIDSIFSTSGFFDTSHKKDLEEIGRVPESNYFSRDTRPHAFSESYKKRQ
ncbi:MAG: hypothetical protein HYW23_00045 [Candidatus Aenigmarchaeota archaeon]|nr:hypothetical protein [Candidatus Aenigmarchaeota archaeon]